MFFWKKDKTREILNSLQNIGKNLATIKDTEARGRNLTNTIESIKTNINEAKKNIEERAKEETTRPWIDEKYDKEIMNLGKNEVVELENFEKKLPDLLNFLDENKTNEEDFLAAQNAAIDQLNSEEKSIQKREIDYEKKIEEFTTKTLRERLSRESDSPPKGSTDDVSWSKITNVVRELGGRIELTGGGHPFKILFPKSSRPVPISPDMSIDRLSRQIRAQLEHIPEHKRNSLTTGKLINALTAGKLLAAA